MSLRLFGRPLAARLGAAKVALYSAVCLTGLFGSGAQAQSATPLFSLAGQTKGRTLSALEKVASPKRTGRTTPLSRASFGALRRVRRGSVVSLPLYAGKTVTGVVDTAQQDEGVLRVSGRLKGTGGTFVLILGGGQVGGVIQMPAQNLALQVQQGASSAPVLQERPLSAILCFPFPAPRSKASRQTPASPQSGASAGAAEVPILNSRPDATAQIYLDFDGETVDDPAWNGDNRDSNGQPQPIVIAPAAMDAAAITETFNRVKEDFAAFNINITTDVSRYNNAAVGQRMRCIIGDGPTTFNAANTAGGIAYVGSFAGEVNNRFFKTDTPCFVFSDNDYNYPPYICEATSHEVGHTLGLSHDGALAHDTTARQEYYAGYNTPTGGWAPIMGVGYYVSVVQWSKGEYAYANNQEDDLAIITATSQTAGQANNFGYATDEAGSTPATAAQLSVSNGSTNQTGAVQQSGDSDTYSFSTIGGDLSVKLAGSAPSPDLDAQMDLLDANGNVLQSSNPSDQLNASISRTLTAGTYFLRITGVGLNTPSDGYSNYGSIGAYALSGAVPPAPVPSFTVTSASDAATDGICTASGNGDGCSLREAIGAANAAPGSTITFDQNVFGSPQTITMQPGTSLPALSSNATITGPTNGVVVAAKVSAPILTIQTGVTATLSSISFSGAKIGVQNDGTLVMTGGAFLRSATDLVNTGTATLSGVLVQKGAVGILNSGTLTATATNFFYNTLGLVNSAGGKASVQNSIVAVNSTGLQNSGTLDVSLSRFGGCTLAMENLSGGTATIQTSTLANNGVGVANSGTLSLSNSTLNANGDALRNDGANASASIVQDTCVGNTNALLNSGAATMSVRRSTISGVGEGIRVGSGAVDVHSSLIVSNGASVVGTLAVDEFNLINGSAQGAGLETDGNGFPVLKDNGGPTFTVALVPGSFAINTGNPGITGGTDQRGLPRVVGGRADIGAFEVQASASSAPQKSPIKPSAPSS